MKKTNSTNIKIIYNGKKYIPIYGGSHVQRINELRGQLHGLNNIQDP